MLTLSLSGLRGVPAYRKRTVVSTEFVTVCGMTFVSEFFPASNIGRPSLPRVETRAFRATWRCSQDAGKMRTLVDCLRLMRDRSIVHERICREDDRKTEKSVCERHRRPKEIGRPPVPLIVADVVCMPPWWVSYASPRNRLNKFAVIRCTRGSGPFGLAPCAEGCRYPGGALRPSDHQIVAALNT